MKPHDSKWNDYINRTAQKPPSKWLVDALQYIPDYNFALEIGAGALNDAVFLLESGFNHVTAIDKTKAENDNLKKLITDKVNYIVDDFVNLVLPENHYSLITSQYTLPFIGPKVLPEQFKKIIKSLKQEGIFVGQFFGVEDDWRDNKNIAFYTLDYLNDLLLGLVIIKIEEQSQNGLTASGVAKHWHVFNVIAKKK